MTAGASPSNGVDADGAGPGIAIGYDEFADIQSGINAVNTNGTVHVAAGNYVANGNFTDPVGLVYKININKPLTLLGPQASYNPNTDSAPSLADQAVITTDVSDPSVFDSTEVSLIGVNASHVTIKGFTLDGHNRALDSDPKTITFDGVTIAACEGIASYSNVSDITVRTTSFGIAYAGIDFENGNNSGNATTNNVISNNLISHLGDQADGYGIGVILYDNFYAQVTGNVMQNVRGGVQTGNFYQAIPRSWHGDDLEQPHRSPSLGHLLQPELQRRLRVHGR